VCNYDIQAADASVLSDNLFFTIAAKENVQWNGGANDDKFYFFENNEYVDGRGGNDSFYPLHDFSTYKFSNLNLAKSSVTITNIALNASAYLTSIENFVFTDKTISFSEIVIPNEAPTGTATIKGLSTWGTKLSITSTIKDADGIGKLSYTWQNDKAMLSTNATYTLADSDIGKQVWAVVSYTDKKGNLEEVKSNVVNVTVSDKASVVNDILTGTDAADKLNGLAGNDTLIGGLGKDSLTGGVGADVFKFNSINDSSAVPKQADTITDFKHAQGDKIDLSAIDANSALPNDQAFTLISAATFSADATGQLRFDAKTSTLYGSTNADAAPEFAIVVSGVKTLVAEDFIL
jgi:Ca2+-binding RTX toxin-like protein